MRWEPPRATSIVVSFTTLSQRPPPVTGRSDRTYWSAVC